jgi:hypothetical protein
MAQREPYGRLLVESRFSPTMDARPPPASKSAGLFVPSNFAAVVAKVMRELMPAFGHLAANPTTPILLSRHRFAHTSSFLRSESPITRKSIVPFGTGGQLGLQRSQYG